MPRTVAPSFFPFSLFSQNRRAAAPQGWDGDSAAGFADLRAGGQPVRTASLKRLDNPLAYTLAAFCCIALESLTSLDRAAQSLFFSGNGWLLSGAVHESWKLWLYTGPKFAIGFTGIIALGVFLHARFSAKAGLAERQWERPCLILFLSIALVPLLVGGLKAVTGVYGPVDLVPYGGEHPHIGLLEHLWVYGRPDGGRSFPAGHASGGFALMALRYLPLGLWRQRLLLLSGFLCGWLMGLYQMARGEHFVSHTLTTMFLALAIISLLARRFDPATSEEPPRGCTT